MTIFFASFTDSFTAAELGTLSKYRIWYILILNIVYPRGHFPYRGMGVVRNDPVDSGFIFNSTIY